MNNTDRAKRALETLQDINPDDEQEETVHADAVVAVEALVTSLSDDQTSRDKRDFEAPDR